MFERFTDRARRVVVQAQEEARLLHHSYIGTEHILLGLTRDGNGLAVKVLESLAIDLDALRQAVVALVDQGLAAPSGHIPFTPAAKKTLELSLREALQLGHNYIGTEHILLALLRQPETPAAVALTAVGVNSQQVRVQIVTFLSSRADAGRPDVASLRVRIAELGARVDSLQAEVRRLSDLLREHGIDPGEAGEAAGAS